MTFDNLYRLGITHGNLKSINQRIDFVNHKKLIDIGSTESIEWIDI